MSEDERAAKIAALKDDIRANMARRQVIYIREMWTVKSKKTSMEPLLAEFERLTSEVASLQAEQST